MQEKMDMLEKKSVPHPKGYQTPPPAIAAPSPAASPAEKKPATKPPVKTKSTKGSTGASAPPVQPGSSTDAPPTEGARLQRLRRLCEKKPSGRCHVPEAVHQRWKAGTAIEREAMVQELEKAGWSKDLGSVNFISLIILLVHHISIQGCFDLLDSPGIVHQQNHQDHREKKQAVQTTKERMVY